MLRRVRCLLFAVLAACAATPGRRGAESAGAVVGSPSWSRLSAPARLFIVSGRVLPVGVATCRSAARHAEVGAGGVSGNCDFVVVLDPDRNLPAIAGQTTLPDGRPLVAFSHAIVEGAANADELAFVLGHEVAHHVADHAPRQIARIDEAAAGAGRTLVAEGDEASSPASLSRVERPALGGAESRASLRGFELEADRLGSRIAAAAGYDEARGVRILGRLERRPGDWRPGDYYLLMRTREAAVSDALSGDA